jgi:hypothetical protein
VTLHSWFKLLTSSIYDSSCSFIAYLSSNINNVNPVIHSTTIATIIIFLIYNIFQSSPYSSNINIVIPVPVEDATKDIIVTYT